jgi:bifunctional non-homologous end joining protein LigD
MAKGDRLDDYRRKRSAGKTPEPAGEAGAGGDGNRFVIQEHHARRLHWDLRLERAGVLVSWALPRGVPADPDENRLAVHTEDHPLEYIDFHGTIPAGQYGAGTMEIWDSGTYEAEKFEPAKVVLRFDGQKVRGRYALFQTRGDDWMIHRMDPPEEGRAPLPHAVEPMRAKPGRLPRNDDEFGYEVSWDGARTLAFCEPGHLRLVGGDGAEVTRTFPEVRVVLEHLHGQDALIDGVVVAFDADGIPSRELVDRRAEADSDSKIRRLRRDVPVAYLAFDLLHLDGRSRLRDPYEERRARLQELGLEGEGLQTPSYHRGDGRALREASAERGLGAIVAKRLTSPYRPGKVSPDWREIPAGR